MGRGFRWMRGILDELRPGGFSASQPSRTVPDPELASRDRISALEDLAPRFFRDVLEMDYDDCLITDESSLWDFHGEQSNEGCFRRIEEVYGIGVRDVASGNLAEILERIRSADAARPTRIEYRPEG